MTTDQQKLIWPATALVCAAIIGAGAYFGLKGNRPSAVPSYGVSATDRTSVEAGVGQAVPDEMATTVYVTRTGACYHRASCTYLRRSKIPMELSRAKQRYRPCSRCNPPR